MTEKQAPGALRLAQMEGQRRGGSSIRDIQEQLDAALKNGYDASDGNLALPGRVSETGLELPPNLPFEQWQQVGFTLKRIRGAWEWWVGDWLNYGERTYGEMYSQAMEETGLPYHRLTQIAYVARHVDPEIRREGLSFGHHEAVAPLSKVEAGALLVRAESEGLKRQELRVLAKGNTFLPAVTSSPLLKCQCSCHTCVLCECK